MGGLWDRITELQPHGSLNYFYGAFLPGFLWPIILLCLILNPYLVYFRVLPCVHMHLSAKVDSSEEVYGQVDITPFFTSKKLLCICIVWKVSLTLE